MKYQVWYMRPEFFRDGILGTAKPHSRDLIRTHIHLKDVETDRGLNDVFHRMQGEVWSPNGEARELIRSKGLQHTSMSVGDVIVDDVGNSSRNGHDAEGHISIQVREDNVYDALAIFATYPLYREFHTGE